jgi:hypothetical protein
MNLGLEFEQHSIKPLLPQTGFLKKSQCLQGYRMRGPHWSKLFFLHLYFLFSEFFNFPIHFDNMNMVFYF